MVDLSVAPLDGEADWYTLTSHEESVQILVSTSKPSKLTTPRQKKVTDGQSADRLPSAWGVAPATTNVAAPRNGCFSFMTNSTCLFFFLLFFFGAIFYVAAGWSANGRLDQLTGGVRGPPFAAVDLVAAVRLRAGPVRAGRRRRRSRPPFQSPLPSHRTQRSQRRCLRQQYGFQFQVSSLANSCNLSSELKTLKN